MSKNRVLQAMSFVTLFLATPAFAEGWCQLVPGWSVITHGTKVDNVFIQGRLEAGSDNIWIHISSPTVGKANIAVALAAQVSGKDLAIYLDSTSATCSSFPSWAPIGEVRHIKIVHES